MRDESGSAFPCAQREMKDGSWNQSFDPGMSLRDYFAAKAMQGFISNAEVHTFVMHSYLPTVAEAAYDLADAMLAARAQ